MMKKSLILAAMFVGMVGQVAAHGGGNGQVMVQKEADAALEQFKSSMNYGEVVLQELLDVLALELDLVHNLLRGTCGFSMCYVLRMRNMHLTHSVPSVVYMYEKIMNVATYNTQIDPVKLCLSYSNKREFLMHMEDVLKHYSAVLAKMQYDASIVSIQSEQAYA